MLQDGRLKIAYILLGPYQEIRTGKANDRQLPGNKVTKRCFEVAAPELLPLLCLCCQLQTLMKIIHYNVVSDKYRNGGHRRK